MHCCAGEACGHDQTWIKSDDGNATSDTTTMCQQNKECKTNNSTLCAACEKPMHNSGLCGRLLFQDTIVCHPCFFKHKRETPPAKDSLVMDTPTTAIQHPNVDSSASRKRPRLSLFEEVKVIQATTESEERADTQQQPCKRARVSFKEMDNAAGTFNPPRHIHAPDSCRKGVPPESAAETPQVLCNTKSWFGQLLSAADTLKVVGSTYRQHKKELSNPGKDKLQEEKSAQPKSQRASRKRSHQSMFEDVKENAKDAIAALGSEQTPVSDSYQPLCKRPRNSQPWWQFMPRNAVRIVKDAATTMFKRQPDYRSTPSTPSLSKRLLQSSASSSSPSPSSLVRLKPATPLQKLIESPPFSMGSSSSRRCRQRRYIRPQRHARSSQTTGTATARWSPARLDWVQRALTSVVTNNNISTQSLQPQQPQDRES